MNIRIKGALFSVSLFLGSTASAQQQQLTVEDIVVMALEKSYDVQLSKNTSLASNTDAKNAVGLFIPDLTLNGSRSNSFQKAHSEYEDRPTNDTKPESTNRLRWARRRRACPPSPRVSETLVHVGSTAVTTAVRPAARRRPPTSLVVTCILASAVAGRE